MATLSTILQHDTNNKDGFANRRVTTNLFLHHSGDISREFCTASLTIRAILTSASELCLFVACLASQQQASVPQERICSDKCTCCHTETEAADPSFHLTQSQYTDTGPTSPSPDPITPGAWQGSHWSANFLSHWYDSTPKKSQRKRDSNPGSSAFEAEGRNH